MTMHARHGNRGGPAGGKASGVYLSLRAEIAAGAYAPGDTLPSEARLAAAHDVARVTIRRALAALAEDGLVETRPGAGSTVTAAAPAPLAADMAAALPQLTRMGRATDVRLLSVSEVAAPDPVARALGLAPGAPVQRAVRLRLSEGRPFSHLTTHVPAAIARRFDADDLARTPILHLLEQAGARPAEADQSVTATAATPDVADALGTALGAPLLALVRTVRDGRGQGVEHLSALYVPDLFRLEMSLARIGAGEAASWAPVIGARP